ncbi:MAG: RHS repeat-associated core domain-containing protein [Acidipila sp.]|nr:RHS repeat-associated core domain-containing protein [Acidipila sp.]
MKRLLLTLCGLSLISWVYCMPTFAQENPNLDVGLKPYGTFEGGKFDSVSMTNGNLNLRIPILSYPQRGTLPYNSFLGYNDKSWKIYSACNSKTGLCSRVYWNYGSSYGNGVEWQSDGLLHLTWRYSIPGQNSLPLFTAQMEDGANHAMAADYVGGVTTLDGTGLWYDGTYPITSGVFRMRNGDTPSKDTNGNFFPASSDTIGRTFGSTTPAPDASGCRVVPNQPIYTAYINTYPGPGGTLSRMIKQCNTRLVLHTGFNVTAMISDNPYPVQEATATVVLLQSIVLYNGTSWSTSPVWTFEYDGVAPGSPPSVNYGNLTRITLPTGGTISYTWTTSQLCTDYSTLNQWSRTVATRTVDAQDGTGPHTWTYTGYGMQDPDGNDTVYTVTGLGGSCSLYVTQVDSYQGLRNSGTLLKTVKTDYQYTANPLDRYGDGTQTVVNVQPIRVTTIWPNGKQTKIENDYDASLTVFGIPISVGDVTNVREYDYASGAPGPLLRTTTNTYLASTNSNYLNANIFDLVTSTTVKNGSGTQIASTTYNYDQSTLSPSGVTVGHDATLTNPGIRGNRTSACRWLNTTGGNLCTTTTYFDTGMPYQATDPLGHISTYSYSSLYAGGYLTQTQMPDTGSPAVHHIIHGLYEFNTGQLTQFTDQNSQQSNYVYDPLGRITSASFPDGGQTTFIYTDTSLSANVERLQKITSTLSTDFQVFFDGLARKKQTQSKSDPQGTVYTDFTYDEFSHLKTASNPYRSTSDPTYGMTTYHYDLLDRGTSVNEQDGSVVRTAYCANTTLVTDEAGKWRRSTSDGAGRLVEVDEPNSLTASVSSNGCPGTGEPIWVTSYAYDALSNLTGVTQSSSRPRSFTYDSLSRLTVAINPESGTINYTYDNDGNVQTKKDARNITITYGYDALNRLTGKTYSNNEPAVSYSYDQSACLGQPTCFNIGRRTSMIDAAGSEAWSYQNMGRAITDQRTTNSVSKSTLYTYNLDGSVATLIYPSGRTITYAPGGAGRPLSAIDTANSITYATNALYSPPGAISSLKNGANLYTTAFFNPRLQPCRIFISSSTTAPTTCLDSSHTGTILDYSYSFGAANNGNVQQIANNITTGRTQSFGYDQVNRLSAAQTQATSGSTCWGESFGYDQWANLLTIGAVTGYTGCTQENLSVSVTASNQLTSAQGYYYDVAGNLTSKTSPGAASYAYNAENQMTSTAGPTYTYDGDGKRVKKSSGKLYWYGMGTDTLDESDASGNITDEYVFFGGKRIARRNVSSGNVYYYFADHLGTSRIVTNATGTILDDSDFYPFGGERVVLSSSGNTYKFTSKERDAESGSDYFGARYYGSTMGRFMSPDWAAKAQPVPYAKLDNPQTLNLYAYVGNNPLSRRDPDGHYECAGTKDQCAAIKAGLDAVRAADAKLKDGTSGKALLDKALKFYGAENTKNGVEINFNNQNDKALGSTSTKDGITTISFGAKALDPLTGTGKGETVAHEGTHGVDQQKNGMPHGFWGYYGTEYHAYQAESAVDKGLGVPNETDERSVWFPGISQGQRTTAITRNAYSNAVLDCENGGCQ